MRQMLSYEQIDENCDAIKKQLADFLSFDSVSKAGGRSISDNNREWLSDLNYIDFLRDIGSCFSVNKMLTFESYRKRMETGLSFIEFNYQLLQSFDFLKLHERHGCALQIGGDDQWGNIVAGVDLIRRKTGDEVFGLTFPLITTSDGKKMGKTEKGALFLDPAQTSVYDFFQYWRNVADADVDKFLRLFTFLPLADIKALLAGDINQAKERLAYEVTAVIHGKEAADTALAGARAAFGSGGDRNAMPGVTVTASALEKGIPFTTLFVSAKLAATSSDARRLIQQGGAFWTPGAGDEQAISDVNAKVSPAAFGETGEIVLRAGKKKFCRVTVQN
jgi:tyrosyl-tRNA synthetase